MLPKLTTPLHSVSNIHTLPVQVTSETIKPTEKTTDVKIMPLIKHKINAHEVYVKNLESNQINHSPNSDKKENNPFS